MRSASLFVTWILLLLLSLSLKILFWIDFVARSFVSGLFDATILMTRVGLCRPFRDARDRAGERCFEVFPCLSDPGNSFHCSSFFFFFSFRLLGFVYFSNCSKPFWWFGIWVMWVFREEDFSVFESGSRGTSFGLCGCIVSVWWRLDREDSEGAMVLLSLHWFSWKMICWNQLYWN